MATMAGCAAARAEFLGQSISAAAPAASNAVRASSVQVVSLFGKRKAAATEVKKAEKNVKSAANQVSKFVAKTARKAAAPNNEELAKWYGM